MRFLWPNGGNCIDGAREMDMLCSVGATKAYCLIRILSKPWLARSRAVQQIASI